MKLIHTVIFYLTIFISVFTFNCALFQSKVKYSNVNFDYSAISKNYFSPTQSKPFPLTVQRGNNLYSSTTKDGRYLFYATDQKGNFDIWFRDLQSSLVVPITDNSFSETKPAISPDGKYLVFVSEEFDSEGDLILLSIDTEEWIQEYLKGNRFINDDFINLTNQPNKKGEYQKGITDTDPVWSPDGKTIYFISDRFTPGLPNLCYITMSNPDVIKPITTFGATTPFISADGQFVYIVSYFEDNKGEVYQYQIANNALKRMTNDNFLDFTPTIDNRSKNLYYSSIRKDTNGNGRLDERDHSLLIKKNLTTGEERILSSGETSNFDVRYSNFNGGSILFSASYYNAINIYFIPENGSIPKQPNIKEQFQYSKTLTPGQSIESYFLALDSVELFYSEDPLFPIYDAQVSLLKYATFKRFGKNEEANSFLLNYKRKVKFEKNNFALVLIKWTESKGNTFNLLNELRQLTDVNFPTDGEALLYHLYADQLENDKQSSAAKDILLKIYLSHPNYHQIDEIKRRLGGYDFHSNSTELSSLYKEMINSWENEKLKFLNDPNHDFSNDRKRDLRYLLEDVIAKMTDSKNSEMVLGFVNSALESNENQKNSIYKQTLLFIKAKALSDLRRYNDSNLVLDSIIPIPLQIDLEPPGKPSVFETRSFMAEYKNPILLSANLLKYYNQKAAGNTSDALRNLKIYLEFYDPILGVDLGAEDIKSAFFYFENKAVEFERIGDLLQSSFHYFFNNQNMFLVKTRNLYLDSIYKEYAIYYQRKMVDTIFSYGKKIREEEERALLNQINILNKDNLNVIGNISSFTSLLTDRELVRSIVNIKDFEKIEVLSGKALNWTELYYKQAVPRARPYLDLATLYGYSYYLINKYVTYESYYYSTGTMTDVRKAEILENFKRAELELRWIIFADPTHYDAYQLLGWLYQYVDLMKLQKDPSSGNEDFEIYENLYKKYFPDKNLEANIELYNQILVFLGDEYSNKKVISDLNLNLGNNYFLLNNYPKANDSYRKVEESSNVLSVKNQFEGYKQEAVYRFNYGKSLIYQGQYKKASEQFSKSIDIYFKNEYYQFVNQYAQEPNSITLSQLNSIRSKLALLFSLRGLSELESGLYEESIVSFQTAIAYNKDVKFISPINLANYLAIAFQKSGRFRDSYQMLQLAETEYQTTSESFYSLWKKWSLWNYFLRDNYRVIGDGRFPGEFPNDFKYLLTLGIRIENHIEQEEYVSALNEIKLRNDLISSKGLDDTIIGKNILAKSRQVEAQIYQRSHLPIEANQRYRELADTLIPNASSKDIEKLFHNYSHSVFMIQESSDVLEDQKKLVLKEFFDDLNSWKKRGMLQCKQEFEICENQFRSSNPKFDLYFGTGLYYQAIQLTKEKKEYHPTLSQSIQILENPGLVDPKIIGLANDPISRQTRVRVLLNLYSIYMMLGDELMAEKKWKETTELAFEFRLDEEKFWSNVLRFRWEVEKSHNPSKLNPYLQDAFQTYQTNLTVRLFAPKFRLNQFVDSFTEVQLQKSEINQVVNVWENYRSLELFRDLISAQFEFEDSKLNLHYQDLLKWYKKYKKITNQIVEKTIKRETIKPLLNQEKDESDKLVTLTEKLKSISPERMPFFEPMRSVSQMYLPEWHGYLQFGNKIHSFNFSEGKPVHRQCLINDGLSICLPIASYPFPLLQVIGKKNDGDLIRQYLLLSKEKGINPSIIFDRNHTKLFNERNERRFKWVTVYGKDTEKFKDSHIRIVQSGNLGILLSNTDYLISKKPIDLQTSLFGDELSQILPFREMFQGSGSEISIVGLKHTNFKTQKQWENLGLIYEIMRTKRIQNIVSIDEDNNFQYSPKKLEDFAKSKNDFLIGNWKPFSISTTDLNKSATSFMELGFQNEKTKEINGAYENYYTASTLLDDTSEVLPSLELRLARLRTEIFPNVSKRSIFRPLWKKYESSPFQNQIRYEFLVSCFSAKDKEDCSYNSSDFIGEDRDTYLGALEFYSQLRSGKFNNFKSKDELRSKIEKEEDPFLQAYRLGSLYIQNYMFHEAESQTKILSKFAKSSKEKNVVKNRILETYFHKAFVFGDKEIYLTPLSSTSAYNFGFKKDWNQFDEKILSRDFTKFGYSDAIYDSYRIRLYTSWKEQLQTGYSEILSLTPEYLTNGQSVLTKLSHLNRTLFFHMILRSIPFQKNKEVNSLFELLLQMELNEGRNYRALFFQLEFAKALYLRGDWDLAEQMVSKIQRNHSELGDGNSYWVEKWNDFKWKRDYLKNQSNNLIVSSSPFLRVYETSQSKKPEEYITLLNELNRKIKNEYLSSEVKLEYEFLFYFLMQKCLEKNSSESFFDLAIAREIFRYTSERFSSQNLYVKNLPFFELYAERLKKRMVGKQEFHGLFDLGKKTYLLSFAQGKSLGRELFPDNKLIYRELVRYFRSSETGSKEVILRESLADKYRTNLRLNQKNRHYLFSSGIHSVVPFSIPDTEYYSVASLSDFLTNPTLRSRDISPKKPIVTNIGFRNSLENEVSAGLIQWETNGPKVGDAPYKVHFSELGWCSLNYLCFDGNPLMDSKGKSTNIVTIYANQKIGPSLQFTNDFSGVAYYLGKETKGLFVLHSGTQVGVHNLYFIRQFLANDELEKPLHIRLVEGKNAAKSYAIDDRYWIGYKLYTSAMIED
ncbi:biopolymer transporter TolR [Leptospira biflexa]|uniref:PD40 domain-containing protein n=1 Tax=Leptospira biflexa TaxID=172 RepID=UPI001091434F|nr:PD40 domain-containing protein [Leptospira biflexa]TGM47826.1 biopolymer transporter TolR [Leptospira biflexa]TGM49708.1 biopolymer transporter TolR [Leptospira biflexa]